MTVGSGMEAHLSIRPGICPMEVIDLVGLRVEGFHTSTMREWFDFAVDPRTTVVLHTCIAEVIIQLRREGTMQSTREGSRGCSAET